MNKVLGSKWLTRMLILTLGVFAVSNVRAADVGDATPIGRIIFTAGILTARTGDGVERPLARGSAVYADDTLVTGVAGPAQMRSNGTLLMLHPASEVRLALVGEGIDIELLRGGFSGLTDERGEQDGANTRVRTTFATLEIRAAHYDLRLCGDGECTIKDQPVEGLFGGVKAGRLMAKTESGARQFGNGDHFYVEDTQSLARLAPRALVVAPPIVTKGQSASTEPRARKPAFDPPPLEAALRPLHPESDLIAKQISLGIHRTVVPGFRIGDDRRAGAPGRFIRGRSVVDK